MSHIFFVLLLIGNALLAAMNIMGIRTNNRTVTRLRDQALRNRDIATMNLETTAMLERMAPDERAGAKLPVMIREWANEEVERTEQESG
jgi:hypothetical protein